MDPINNNHSYFHWLCIRCIYCEYYNHMCTICSMCFSSNRPELEEIRRVEHFIRLSTTFPFMKFSSRYSSQEYHNFCYCFTLCEAFDENAYKYMCFTYQRQFNFWRFALSAHDICSWITIRYILAKKSPFCYYFTFCKGFEGINTNTCVLRTNDNRTFEDLHSFGDEISDHELQFVAL